MQNECRPAVIGLISNSLQHPVLQRRSVQRVVLGSPRFGKIEDNAEEELKVQRCHPVDTPIKGLTQGLLLFPSMDDIKISVDHRELSEAIADLPKTNLPENQISGTELEGGGP